MIQNCISMLQYTIYNISLTSVSPRHCSFSDARDKSMRPVSKSKSPEGKLRAAEVEIRETSWRVIVQGGNRCVFSFERKDKRSPFTKHSRKLSCSMREFQRVGAEKAKERRLQAELTRGTTSRCLLLDLRFLVVILGTRRSDR